MVVKLCVEEAGGVLSRGRIGGTPLIPISEMRSLARSVSSPRRASPTSEYHNSLLPLTVLLRANHSGAARTCDLIVVVAHPCPTHPRCVLLALPALHYGPPWIRTLRRETCLHPAVCSKYGTSHEGKSICFKIILLYVPSGEECLLGVCARHVDCAAGCRAIHNYELRICSISDCCYGLYHGLLLSTQVQSQGLW